MIRFHIRKKIEFRKTLYSESGWLALLPLPGQCSRRARANAPSFFYANSYSSESNGGQSAHGWNFESNGAHGQASMHWRRFAYKQKRPVKNRRFAPPASIVGGNDGATAYPRSTFSMPDQKRGGAGSNAQG